MVCAIVLFLLIWIFSKRDVAKASSPSIVKSESFYKYRNENMTYCCHICVVYLLLRFQTSRLFKIIYLLLNKERMTTKELAERLAFRHFIVEVYRISF